MQCPKCEAGTLCKIQFKTSKKIAHLCDGCENFWYTDEHIDSTTGHALEPYAEGVNTEDTFVFLHEEDKDRQEVHDLEERVEYESL